MSSSRPNSHYYTNSMNSQGSYDRFHSGMDIPSSPDFQRRIWVKIANGNPTTILVLAEDLVDDLKTMIMMKYPNSLGKTWDSADLTIKLEYHKGLDKKQNLSVSPEKSGFNHNININNMNAHSTISNGSFINKFITLEPDQNVFSILDNYYPTGMNMYEALIIEHPQNVLPNLPCYQPKPQYNINTKIATKERSSSPNLNQNSSQLSPILHSKQSPIPSGAHIHRRSQSNPPQSPASQAVLLLPKNFSLTGNEAKKNDDEKFDKLGAVLPKRSTTSLSKINTDNLSTNESTPDSTPEPVQKSSGLQVLKQNPVLTSPSRTPTTRKATQDIDDQDDKHDKEEKFTSNNQINGTNKLTKLTKKVDAMPVKSTTEKVLPSISVLVVEDNAINQAILGAFLRKHKIHYQIAKNGQEAIDKWRKGGFHLILMDIQLPIKSGIEATKEIRYLEKINHIGVFNKSELINSQSHELTQEEELDLNSFRSPVIIVALTASSNSSVDRQNALMAGCNDYLTKPVNLVWLQNKIAEWGCMQALIDFDGWKKRSLAFSSNKAKENHKDGNKRTLDKAQIKT